MGRKHKLRASFVAEQQKGRFCCRATKDTQRAIGDFSSKRADIRT
jgi:hypothetical protein